LAIAKTPLNAQPNLLIKRTKLNLKLFFQVSSKQIFGDRPVGKGYDVLSDRVKTFDIFDLEEDYSENGFKIPKGFCLSRIDEKETFEDHFENKTSFAQERLNHLGLGDVNPKLLNLKARAGFSIGGQQTGKASKSENSYCFESRPWKMSISNLDKLHLNKGFRKDVTSDTFPSKYIESGTKKQKDMTEFFKGFFSKWGHYIITMAYIGGSVELQTSSVDSNNKGSNTSSIDVGLEIGFKMLSLGPDFTSSAKSDGNLGMHFSSIKLNWNGGDPQFQVSNLDLASPEKWKSWEESLNDRPSFLTTSLQLLPISKIVALIDEEKGKVCQKVMSDLIGKKQPPPSTSYRYVPPAPSPAPAPVYAPATAPVHAPAPAPAPATIYNQAMGKPKDPEPPKTRQEAAAAAVTLEPKKCFPGTAEVIIRNSIHSKLVSELSIGDEVLCMDPRTKKKIFSKVYMFGHRNEDTKSTFLKISCDNGTNVTLSPKHLIFVTNNFKAKQADQVEIGDHLVTRNQPDFHPEVQPAKVVKIEEVILNGFYAPFTLCGNMIVDGFLASCYANVNEVTLPLIGKMSAQDVAHFATAPLRIAYLLGSRDVLKIQEDQEMPKCIETMHKIGRKMKIAF
jgi:hypothetical protein